MREEWERERIQRERNKNITEKEYIKYLKIKRCRNEEEVQRRIKIARDGFLRSQEHLRKLLREKDERTKMLMKNLFEQKVAERVLTKQL